MCQSCGGTCGSARLPSKRMVIDVKVNGRLVYVKDTKAKAFDRFPLTFKSVRDASRIGSQIEDTPEGFLKCLNVPLARTGDQIYLAHEVRGVPPKDGRVIAQRDAEEVFHPDAIESFRGKPLTDDHPWEDVGPSNYKDHLIGVVQNPRRGEAPYAHCIVGDLMVYDPDAIRKIKSGAKRELSCGYDAAYEVIAPGRARQVNIRGNHVSLVDQGRCGPECAI